MQDRTEIIEKAAALLETGRVETPDGQAPQAMADMLRTAHGRGGLGAYAAYKTAQRILAADACEPVAFTEIHARDRIRFATDHSIWGGGSENWRTGTVIKTTDIFVMAICDNQTRAILRAEDWEARKVQRLAEDPS